ncbi:hypothetical protein CBR_g16964 [Chara braunii]|uniref:Uncharacterized protein n=1 Tax=Chara braunii TaxID=69332 RepID=A0A388KU89_CHABU|nr:hypothetical protein CBR_g16964 [Chara braunii]|eukprot:GBG73621.1 hypothetical protein CBR_g16964 [Chara braunii]
MQQHFEEERVRKENRLRRKQEKEEEIWREEQARAHEDEERAIREAKAKKKKDRLRCEAESRAELKKDLGMQLVMQVSEMEEKFVQRMKRALAELQKLPSGKGKGVKQFSDTDVSGSGSEASVMQELSERTTCLVISEKWMRGPDKVVGDNPTIQSSAKRTPRQRRKQATFAGRMTRARAKVVKSPGSVKRTTPVRTPLSAAKRQVLSLTPGLATPNAKGSLARYKYRILAMMGLKQLDANELQRICRDEGIPYDGKIDVIFDIADHRTYLHFGEEQAPLKPIETIRIEDSETTKSPEDQEDDVAY